MLPLRVFPLASGLYEVEWRHTMAAVPVATLPVAIAFIWLQRYLMSDTAAGALK
jgi:multiple sugar transport system permease protein